jgi:hypothetical protein
MLRKILWEICVLLFSLSLVPAVIIAVLIRENAFWQGFQFFLNRTLIGDPFPESSYAIVLFKWFSPYLIIQAIRAFFWSKTSSEGKRWANLYYSMVLGLISLWFLCDAMDTFYFMYALGDIPSEFLQFIRLEFKNLLIFIGSLVFSIYCFMIFINLTVKNKKTKQ